MAKTTIDWPWKPLHTINLVDGCPRGCSKATMGFNCYAKLMNDRFHYVEDWSKPEFFPERLEEFKKLKEGDSCFVDSMSDVAFWKLQWKEDAIHAIKSSLCENFLILSKSCTAYEDIDWPYKCQLGLTITCRETNQKDRLHHLLGHSAGNRVFVSIEPLLGEINLGNIFPEALTWFVVGAESGRGAEPPRKEWIDSVKLKLPKERVYWKPSIRAYL